MKEKTPWGYFSKDGSELVITTPETPFPWMNYLYDRSGAYYTVIDQRGQGASSHAFDQNKTAEGRDFFLRTGDVCWSLNGRETFSQPGKYVCRMTPGLVRFQTENRGIQAELSCAVSPDAPVEGCKLTLKNCNPAAVEADLTSVFHVRLLGSDNSQQLDRDWFDEKTQSLILRRYHSECKPNKYAAFFTGSAPVSSWCGSLEDFLGADVSFGRAFGLRRSELGNETVSARTPLFALRSHLRLLPGKTQTFFFAFGIADTAEDARNCAAQLRKKGQMEHIFSAAAKFYREVLAPHRIVTPDPQINAAANIWTRLQLFHQNISGRSGIMHNWRNNLQDSMGFLAYDPAVAAKRLTELAALTFADGFVPRSTMKDGSSPADNHYIKQHHNDIGCWYAYCGAAYFQETGDLALLKKKVFNVKRHAEITVGDAITGGLIWTLSNRGIHGLIRFMDGDWSDPLEKAGRRGIGESVWTSVAVVAAINAFAPVLRAAGRVAEAERLEQGAQEVRDAVNRNAWDGAWYIRGITDDGVKFCRSADPDARISMLVQAWAVLAGIGSEKRLSQAMNAVSKFCKTPIGPMLYGPPFLEERPGIGRESAKAPGCGENGSCYTHGTMMLAAAELVRHAPDEALHLMKQVMFPMAPADCGTRRGCPLWWSNYLESPFGAAPGRSSNIISSGAPAWFIRNLLNGFCGIRPRLDGMEIVPELPREWDEVRLSRLWRSCEYDITIRRTGKKKILLDGRKNGGLLPLPRKAGEHHTVLVEC